MTRGIAEILSADERARCERLAERSERPSRGQRLVDAAGLLLAPVLLLLARADASQPAWSALLLAFVGGAILGVVPTRLLADRGERLVALLYAELSRRERGEGGAARRT